MKKPSLTRVTTVLDYVESNWKIWWYKSVGFEEAERISRESAQFGTNVHKLVENTLLGKEIEPESEEQALCANEILQYLQAHNIEPLFETFEKSMEIEVSDTKLGLVGHFDFAGKRDGVPYIIDFKTSNKMRKSFPLQKSAYAKMANKQFGVEIDNGLTIRSHWNKEKKMVEFEVKEYPNLIKQYYPKFKSCLEVYRYFTRKDK